MQVGEGDVYKPARNNIKKNNVFSTNLEKGYLVIILYLSMECDNLGSFASSFSTSILALFWWKLAAEHNIVIKRREPSKFITYPELSLILNG